MTPLTIFTITKPFTNPHIAMIQRNAILSWKNLGPQVKVILIGNEEGIAETAAELGVVHIPDVKRNSRGTPLVSSTFKIAHEAADSELLAYINADILTLPDFLQGAETVKGQLKRFLIIGRRWDLDVRQPLDFSQGWDARLKETLQKAGRPHAPSGSDYFIFPRGCFEDMPDFAIGRPTWDNWTIYYARSHGVPVVNATESITIIHQDHDYSHLPGGLAPYGGPEAGENLHTAGGRRALFFQHDSNWFLVGTRLRRAPLTWQRFWREVEIFPMVTLHSVFLGQLAYAIFHPVKAFRELRASLNKRLRSNAQT